MKILFIHQNFPGQFKHLAPALVTKGHDVAALHMNKSKESHWRGVNLFSYYPNKSTSKHIHPWVMDFETKVIRAEACYRACHLLKQSGFNPDVVIAHPGWGESMFVKEVWPHARVGLYCEYFYQTSGADVGFDTDMEVQTHDDLCAVRLKNANNYINMEIADSAVSPTVWQASTFPQWFQHKIHIIHDGINTEQVSPNNKAFLKLNQRIILTRDNEIITFVNRNLEPYRGYHIFMKALPEILTRRPNLHVIIIGGDKVSYGAARKDGLSWKNYCFDMIKDQLQPSECARIHFLGRVDYKTYLNAIQLSSLHIYLTYPFVLSWSLLEAMSVGTPVLVSDTSPLHEVILADQTGFYCDFFDYGFMSQCVCRLLEDVKLRQTVGQNARKFIIEHYDLEQVCLPRLIQWVADLVK